jgi:cytochrome c-type biogenesis protein CcmF
MHENAIATLGDAGLLLSLVVSAYAVGASVAGARRGSKRLVNSGIYGAYAATALVAFSSAVLWFSILSNDYSIKYVQRHSDASMPWFYKLTAFWGGLDGSIMWWVLLLALFASVAIYVNRDRHRELIPYVTAVLFTVVGFFLFLIIYEKRPFDIFLTEAPKLGKGMNPLLQNPYMATHPPSLYLGFVSATVPFAFGMAALITGNLDDSWIQSCRRWTLVSWYFLSQGLILGALWAYEELGWGGYWGWDPVENAGFLPWLTSTAFLHSIMIQERRGMLKVWNVCLVITTFLLTIFGTFMTRSGIVQSVHAFGQDTELAIIFGCFIAFTIIFCFGYVIYRLPLLRAREELDSWVSREFAFLLNNWVLLSAALFILTATMFPTLSEWLAKERVTVGPPFFNKWMAPIGLVLLFLTGYGPLIAWRRASVENLRQQFTWPTVGAAGTFGAMMPFKSLRVMTPLINDSLQLPVAIICFSLCAFVLVTIGQEYYRGTRVRQMHTKLDFATSLIGLVRRNKRRFGGYLVHVAIVLMFLGFAGGAYKQEKDVTLEKGGVATIAHYNIRFDGLRFSSDAQKDVAGAALTVTKGGRPFAQMRPEKWAFHHHEDEPPTTEVDIDKSLKEDLYLVLNGYEAESGIANLKIVINPLVNWIWIGFMLLAMGTVIAFMPDHAYALAGAASTAGKIIRAVTIFVILVGFGVARAEPPNSGNFPRNDHERSIFQKLKCLCGTCLHALDECGGRDDCGSAVNRRGEILRMLEQGMSDQQILDAEVAKYGPETLRMPVDKGINRLAWILPYGAFLGAAGVLVMFARRWSRKKPAPAKPDAPAGEDTEYADKLADELDKLD